MGHTHSPARQTLARLIRQRRAQLGLTLLTLLFLLALLAPLIAPADPLQMGSTALQPPSPQHIFGSDQFGRDVLSRVLHGGRRSLPLGIVPVVLAAVVGVTLGLLAGYEGRWLATFILRLTDVMLGFPVVLLALFLVAMLGRSLWHVMLAVGIAATPNYIRLTYGSVLAARQQPFVLAAEALGATRRRILLVHILPGIAAPLIVLATLGMGQAILTGAALSYLGLGAQPPQPEWGLMVAEGQEYLRNYGWIAGFPGLAIMLAVLGINLLGDGVQDALDPRLVG